MLLGVSIPFLSGCGGILSGEFRFEFGLGPGEAKTYRIGGGLKHGGDLTGLQLLPSPEPEQFLIRLRHLGESGLQSGIVRFMGGGGGSLIGHAFDQAEVALPPPSLIGQSASGNAITPRQRGIGRNIVETPPNGQQDVTQGVGGVIGCGASAQITLQRLVHLGGDELETLSPLDVGVHWWFLSGTALILSALNGKRLIVGSLGLSRITGLEKIEMETEHERTDRQEQERKDQGEQHERERKEESERNERERKEESERYERERKGG